MDPNAINHEPNFDLPEPVSPAAEVKGEQQAAKDQEKPVSREKSSTEQPLLSPLSPPSLSPDPSQAIALAASSDDAVSVDPADPTAGAMIADDVDLIEKEWVTKAKAIVDNTKDDPHRQNKELNKVKADYIKKRYNKDIRISED